MTPMPKVQKRRLPASAGFTGLIYEVTVTDADGRVASQELVINEADIYERNVVCVEFQGPLKSDAGKMLDKMTVCAQITSGSGKEKEATVTFDGGVTLERVILGPMA